MDTGSADYELSGILNLTYQTGTHITLNANGGNALTPGTLTTGADGRLASLPTPTRSNYRFDGWFTAASGGTQITPSYVFTADTTIYARWTYIGSSGGSGGSGGGSSSGSTAQPTAPVAVWYLNDKGDLEKVNCTFKDGIVNFDLDHLSLYVVGRDNKEAGWENPFTDVSPGAWYYDAVSYIAAKGITSGTTATSFSPDATLTRGQFITLLMRAYEIAPDKNPADNFADAGNTYYTGYLAAAKRLGLAQGIGDNQFAPEQAITRQDMFTLLYNALMGINQLPQGNSGKTLNDFTDSDTIPAYAQEAMAYLVKTGTVSGSNDKLTPADTTTRAQMTQVLYNLIS